MRCRIVGVPENCGDERTDPNTKRKKREAGPASSGDLTSPAKAFCYHFRLEMVTPTGIEPVFQP